MQTSKDIVAAIIGGGFNTDQLNEIVDGIKFARSRIAQQNMFTMRVGAKVKFTNSRTGVVEVGEVYKVNRTKIIVKVGMTRWTVPAAMLSPA